MQVDERGRRGRPGRRGRAAAGAGAAAVAVAWSLGATPSAGQAASVPYTCDVVSIIGPLPAVQVQVTAMGTAPATADVGTAVDVTGVDVDVQFDPEDFSFALVVEGAATLGPGGSAQALPTIAVGGDGLARFTGATGSVVATGDPGTDMDVTLDRVVVSNPLEPGSETVFVTFTCSPTGAPAVLTTVGLTGEPSPTTTQPPTPTTTAPGDPGDPGGPGDPGDPGDPGGAPGPDPVATPPPARPVTASPTFTG